ncbi:MAG: iron hydrogenase, partial [Clostridia bacterium]|nr:iron hydrogenase [Clostridia bacterium]
MKTFWELYDFAIRQALMDDFDSVAAGEGYDPGHLDCLLHPDKHPLVIRTGECLCGPDEQESCVARCPFGAIRQASAGGIEIDPELCVGCSDCIAGCQRENLAPNTDVYPALKAVRSSRE